MWGIYTILIHTVKEHLTITVFGKGQYGVVTIVFPDLLFYFCFRFSSFTRYNSSPPPIYYTPPCGHQKLSDALRCVSGCEVYRTIRLMPKTAPRRSQRAILLLSHPIYIMIVFSSTRMPMNALKPSTSSSMPGKCFDMAKSISSYTAI